MTDSHPSSAGVSATDGLRCAACQAPLADTSKFCPQCGAPVGGAGAPPSAPKTGPSPPVDIRAKVEENRGSLKRLQMLIPGYRTYRAGEDIREADSYLRLQVADRLRNSMTTIQNVRSSLTNSGQFSVLNDLAPLLADLQMLEGSIRHAEQGYSGISAPIRVGNDQLDRLYEYDYGFVEAADQLNRSLASLPSLAMGSDTRATQALLSTVRAQVSQLRQAFQARLRTVQGLQV